MRFSPSVGSLKAGLFVTLVILTALLLGGGSPISATPNHGPQIPSQDGKVEVTLVGPRRVVVRDLPPPPPTLPALPREVRFPRRVPFDQRGQAAGPLTAAPAANAVDPAFSAPAEANTPPALSALARWEGLDNNDNAALAGVTVTPPDPQVAVGPNHVFEMVNIVGEVYTRTGSVAQAFTLASFFRVPADYLDFDPKVLYDALSGRWFASYASLIDKPGNKNDEGRLHLAISQTSDPTGAWNVYFARYSQVFPDYPGIGVTNDKFTISSNVFDIDQPFYYGVETLVVEKADVMAGVPGPQVGLFAFPFNLNRFTVRPAHSLSPVSDQYLVTRSRTSATTLTLIRITGTPDAANVSEASATNLTILAQSSPPPSVALGGNIDSGDFRLLDAVYRDGRLWASASARCRPPGDTEDRSCAHLIEVDTVTNTIAQDIMFGTPGQYFSWPAVRTDASGDLYVSLTRTHAAIYPEARAAGRLASEPPNTMSGSALLRGGDVAHDSDRWGDYLGAAVDPTFPDCVWLVGQYAKDTLGRNWGTYIAATSYSGGCDSDNDGIVDASDNCPSVANPSQADGDADGLGDACDNCPTVANASQANWNNDALGDACQDSDLDSQGLTLTQIGGACPTAIPMPVLRDCIELFLGTDPGVKCPATTTANDEAVDAWGPDFNDTRKVDGLDAFLLAQRFGSTTTFTPAGRLPYSPRYDLNADGAINPLDVSIFALYFNKTCS